MSEIKLPVLLWLDDQRDPNTEQWLKFSAIQEPYEVVWVKSYKEFTKWIQENGLPAGINFDHDLADEHYTPEQYWHCYHISKEFQDSRTYTEKTGLDCAKFLVDYCIDYAKQLPKWYTHSANPVGRDNIDRYLVNYLRSLA